jgi:hypothetical protein
MACGSKPVSAVSNATCSTRSVAAAAAGSGAIGSSATSATAAADDEDMNAARTDFIASRRWRGYDALSNSRRSCANTSGPWP